MVDSGPSSIDADGVGVGEENVGATGVLGEEVVTAVESEGDGVVGVEAGESLIGYPSRISRGWGTIGFVSRIVEEKGRVGANEGNLGVEVVRRSQAVPEVVLDVNSCTFGRIQERDKVFELEW